MNKITPKQVAWLLPIAYLLHLFDEYFSTEGFHNWFSEAFNVNLSLNDFILINSIGFAITLIISVLYNLNKIDNLIIATMGILFFINGLVHLTASVLTLTYSPGTLSGLLFYLPLGYLVYKKIYPLLKEQQRIFSFAIAIMLQVVVALIALNI